MKTYELKPTSNPALERVVDRDGDWRHYRHVPSGTYLRSVNFILDSGYAKGTGFYTALKNSTAEEWERRLEAAGDKGDAVHQLIKKILSGEQVTRTTMILADDNVNFRLPTYEEFEAALAMSAFWADHACKLVIHEYPVYNLPDGYAGTLDVICRITKACGNRYCRCEPYVGKLGLLDWKSGGGIWDNYGPQDSAYWTGIATMVEDPISALAGQIEFTGIVRVGTNHKVGYQTEFYDKTESETHYREFLAARTIHDANYRPFDPEKEVYEIPDIINITVETEQLPAWTAPENTPSDATVKPASKATKTRSKGGAKTARKPRKPAKKPVASTTNEPEHGTQ